MCAIVCTHNSWVQAHNVSFWVLGQWPCVIFIIPPPAHSLKSCFKERQDRNNVILSYSLSEHHLCVSFFVIISNPQFSVSTSTNKLYQQTQHSDTRLRSIRPETNFGRQQWKKRIRPVLWGKIEVQNVNFSGKLSPVDWTVKRSTNAHFMYNKLWGQFTFWSKLLIQLNYSYVI